MDASERIRKARYEKGQLYLNSKNLQKFENYIQTILGKKSEKEVDSEYKTLSQTTYKMSLKPVKFDKSSSEINKKFQSISDSYINVLKNTKEIKAVTKSLKKNLGVIEKLKVERERLKVEITENEQKWNIFKSEQKIEWETSLKLKMLKENRQRFERTLKTHTKL